MIVEFRCFRWCLAGAGPTVSAKGVVIAMVNPNPIQPPPEIRHMAAEADRAASAQAGGRRRDANRSPGLFSRVWSALRRRRPGLDE